MSSEYHIDALLEQYLHLLDEYTKLRNLLNTLQLSVYHHISRANFSAERGIRYGQDFYDDRMQASITMEVTDSNEAYKFSIINKHKQVVESATPNQDTAAPNSAEDIEDLQIEEINIRETKDKENKKAEEEEGVTGNKVKPPRTPLSWFGILTPGAQSLRSAQTASVSMISTIMPQMVTLDYEMKELEIRIRRAKKFRAKAEADISKKTHAKNAGVETTVGLD